MRPDRQKIASGRFLVWTVLVTALTVGGYLAGARLVRLWATPPLQEIPSTPTIATRVEPELLVPDETAEGTLGPDVMETWQFGAQAGQVATLEMWFHPLDISSPDAGFGLDVTGPDGVTLISETGSASPRFIAELELPASGTYRVRIVPLSGSLGRYSLRLSLTGEAPVTRPEAITTAATATLEATPVCRTHHTVVEGDSLWAVAQAFNVTYEAIVEANDHVTPPYDSIDVGLVLCIPAPPPTPTPLPEGYYVVQNGDTLGSLAWKFEYTIEDWIAANAGALESHADYLGVGEVLRIPEHSSLDDPLKCARVPDRQEVVTYAVQSGDTLWCLANKFGITMATIRWANRGVLTDDPDVLALGIELRILPLDGVLHIVTEGETLESIAERSMVEVADIVDWNPNDLTPESELTAGQEVVIPNGEPPLHVWAPPDPAVTPQPPGVTPSPSVSDATPSPAAPGVTPQPPGVTPSPSVSGVTPLPTEPGVTPQPPGMTPSPPVSDVTPPPTAPGATPPPPGTTPSPPVSDVTPLPTAPGATPLPTAPAGATSPGAIQSRHDPWYALSDYDTGYCSSRAAGGGWSGSLSWPVRGGQVDQSRIFVPWHPAIDIDAPVGVPVYAAETGVAIWAGNNTWGYGNLIILAHGGGWQTYYAHLTDVYAGCGQTVTKGELIGTVGETGQSSVPHLHFELRRGTHNHNPLDRLP